MAMLPVRRGSTERADPLSYVDDVSNYMNRMMGSFFPSMDVADQTWTPLVDMSENEKEYRVDIEVPGVRREDITIDMEGQELAISGRYRSEDHAEGSLRRSTRRRGQFEYAVRLPHSVDADKTKAMLKDGVLSVTVPKRKSSGQKKIEIK